MRVFGIELSRVRADALSAVPVPIRSGGSGGWMSIIRESFAGAWQRNVEVSTPSVMAYPPVFACTTLIASDVGKCRIRLVEQDDAGVWTPTTSPAFSPFLRKPNRYQTFQKFAEQWIVSKLTHGNTYALKQRDRRGVVVAAYVLDPQQVTPLVAPDGSVYYRLGRNDLAGVAEADDLTGQPVTVPAREIFHDLMVPLFHPLIGVTPIYACGLVALQGMKIGENSTQFFATGSNPGGVLTAPGAIDQTTADRLKKYWDENFTGANVGRVAVLGDGLKYEAMSVNATDSQLIEQLQWTVEQVCACYHVPAALIDSSHQPPYANSEPLVAQYYGQCLQSLFVAFENTLDEGCALPEVDTRTLGTEFDIDDLIWLDVATRTKAATDAIVGGVLSPNESRFKYFGVGAVEGGASPYMQQQMVSIAALADRDATKWLTPAPAAPAPVPALPPAADDDLELDALTGYVLKGVLRAA
jgi:HK97 family phage portal protein